MFLQNKQTGTLVEIRDLEALTALLKTTVVAQGQAGQEKQDPEEFEQQNLVFPSGESLPCCWVDENYETLEGLDN
ncbi:acetyltransferase [Scytonema hofmannii PCC 7110]|uniref:Acetyltransferase n=1 Tax=Scytonema hofmannii PCC 7110 TaxID=128403 RepID=A0A139WWQ5_9CYAN|nr:hypothetical protein [Scytonema hofmannii]KYC36812.1 acetyltransferase [Scytonema hofmannii PCC 7110]